jgi:hypothetical protein
MGLPPLMASPHARAGLPPLMASPHARAGLPPLMANPPAWAGSDQPRELYIALKITGHGTSQRLEEAGTTR